MSSTCKDSQKRADMLYNYELYSLRQFRVFSKYAWKTAKEVSDNYGGSRLGVWLHMMWCNVRYGANHNRDYTLFEFYKKRGNEIDTFLTHRRFFKLVKQFDKETFYALIDKSTMYRRYADFIKRDWLLTDESTDDDVIDFIKKHKRVLVKPISSDSGKGIYSISDTEIDVIQDLLRDMKEHSFLIEEVVENCEELKALCSTSLNTLRIDTLVNTESEIEIFSVHLRCGCGDSVVDNWGAGGVAYPVDIATGIIIAPGLDYQVNRHIYHPGTEKIMIGYKIPRYEEACQLAKEVIRTNMKVVYAGLDLAILEDRIELIEVNFPPAHVFQQTIDQVGKYDLTKRIRKT